MSLDEVPQPELVSDRSVVIEVEGCGVCGTDYEEVQHGPKVIPVGTPHPLTGRVAPLVMGHEILGRVVQSGSLANRRPGDRVVVWPQISCDACPSCIGGEPLSCERQGALGLSTDGGFARFVAVAAESTVTIDDDIAFERAVLVEPYAVALHALASRAVEDRVVMIVGIGSIGLALVETARALGARMVMAVSRSRVNLDAALAAGADRAISPGDVQEADADVVVDASGGVDALTLIGRALARHGTGVVVGVRAREISAPVWDIFSKELRLVGSNGMHYAEFAQAARMISNRQLACAPRTISKIPLSRLPATLRAGAPAGVKVVAVAG